MEHVQLNSPTLILLCEIFFYRSGILRFEIFLKRGSFFAAARLFWWFNSRLIVFLEGILEYSTDTKRVLSDRSSPYRARNHSEAI